MTLKLKTRARKGTGSVTRPEGNLDNTLFTVPLPIVFDTRISIAPSALCRWLVDWSATITYAGTPMRRPRKMPANRRPIAEAEIVPCSISVSAAGDTNQAEPLDRLTRMSEARVAAKVVFPPAQGRWRETAHVVPNTIGDAPQWPLHGLTQ